MELENLYLEHKSLLLAIAYRMLGSLTEAEDVVQDSFLAIKRLADPTIEHSKAYLIKTVTNRCLNVLQSSRITRESYIGTWLPEPVVVQPDQDPTGSLLMKEDLSYAFLVLLQQLSPLERALFILREVLDYEYKDIAFMLDKTEASCRKMFSRLKPKVNTELPIHAPDREAADQLVQLFMSAAETGNFEAFIQCISQDAVLMSDGGGKVRAAIYPIIGKNRVAAFWEGIAAKGALLGDYRPIIINGEMGIAIYRDGRPQMVISFEYNANNLVHKMFIVLNPDKLGRLL